MTTLIIDGYNAIYAIPSVKKKLLVSLADARGAIVSLSREYARSSGYIDNFRVVFDGNDRYRYLDSITPSRGKTHVFSRTGQGDDKVIEMARKYSEKGRVVVASNDNYVRNNARAHGANIIDVRDLSSGKRRSSRVLNDKECLKENVKQAITREYRKVLGV